MAPKSVPRGGISQQIPSIGTLIPNNCPHGCYAHFNKSTSTLCCSFTWWVNLLSVSAVPIPGSRQLKRTAVVGQLLFGPAGRTLLSGRLPSRHLRCHPPTSGGLGPRAYRWEVETCRCDLGNGRGKSGGTPSSDGKSVGACMWLGYV
jgi:hypothetical protein